MKSRNRILAVAVGVGAIALTGGQLAPVAHAGGPSLYGQLNVSLDHLDSGEESALNLSSNRSRLGVKGDIEVHDGLKAIYQIESELRADSANAGTLASRNTFVGLEGGFGTVRAGRFDTPVKLIGRQVDLFANQVGDLRNLARARPAPERFDERPHNSVAYDSPTFGGVSASLQYSTNTDDGPTATNDNDTVSVGLNYAEGPAYIGVGYERAGNADLAQDDPSAIRVAGYYDLGQLRFTAFWQSISGIVSANDEDVYGVGVRFRQDAWTFKAQAYQLSADANEADATLLAVGAEYALARPVTLYLNYALADNDDNRGVVPYREGRGDVLPIAGPGEKASAVSFGTIYRF